MNTEELKAAIDNKSVQLFDLRSKKEFDLSHIEGAMYLDLDAFENEGLFSGESQFEEGKKIVVYGICPRDPRLKEALEKLKTLSTKKFEVLDRGYRGWVVDKLPCQPPVVAFGCMVCAYGYYPERGDETQNIAPGTLFEELPDTWRCPWCGVTKEEFQANL
jgi:rubredoxin/rhodanese-related sulfurtransferase